jgi:hypothetical protein
VLSRDRVCAFGTFGTLSTSIVVVEQSRAEHPLESGIRNEKKCMRSRKSLKDQMLIITSAVFDRNVTGSNEEEHDWNFMK